NGIYFSNDSANNDISTALAELNDIFFVEDSSSESELIILDNEIKSESDNDKSFNSSNKIYLNSFEYIDNPNNYIKDKAYDDLKLKLMAFQKDENMKKVTATNRKYLQFNYCFNNSLLVCCTIYEALVGVNHKYIDTIIQYLKEYSLDKHIHSNISKSPKNINRVEINYDIISMPVIFLRTSYSYASVYHDYIQAFKAEYPNEIHIIAESTFTKVWKTLILSLQFILLKSDLCETCEIIELDIQYANEYEKKIEITENYLAYLNRAKKEHDYYNANIKLVINDST
ncbi:8733_t:CDS:2, partial [Scutellospora calospora]